MSKWVKILFPGLLILAAVFVWRLTSRANLPNPEVSSAGYRIWTVAHLKDGLSHKDFTLVNVHIPFEGQLAKTDLAIPYDKVDENLAKLPQDKNAKIVLYCRSGRMSEIAATELVRLGYTNVFTVAGGMIAWQESGGRILQK